MSSLLLFSCLCMLIAPAARCATSAKNAVPTKPLPVLKGQFIFTYPINGDVQFGYAILYVDGVGAGLSNSLPLRFDLNTTLYPDGAHSLMIELYDDVGLVVQYPPILVRFQNEEHTGNSPSGPAMQPASKTLPDTRRSFAPRQTPQVMLDGEPVNFDIRPFFSKDRIMVMLRPLVSMSGGDLHWQGKNGSATIASQTYFFTQSSPFALWNNEQCSLVQPLLLHQNRMFAPVAIWRDLFGAALHYDEQTKTVNLQSPMKMATRETTMD